MKKYLLIAGAGLLLTAGVTATMVSTSGKKKTTTDISKKSTEKKKCSWTKIVCF